MKNILVNKTNESDNKDNTMSIGQLENMNLDDQCTANNGILDMTIMNGKEALLDISTIVKRTAEEFFSINNEYTYYTDDPYYRNLLYRSFCKFYHIDNLSERQIFFGCGTPDLWKSVLHYILPKGKIIGLAQQFPAFISYANIAGFSFKGYFSEDLGFPLGEIISAINKEREKCACILIDRPSILTGMCCSLNEVKTILDEALKYGIYVVIDEAYANYIPVEESVVSIVKEYNNAIWMRSNSKAYGIGTMRTGAIAFGSNSVAANYSKIHSPFTPDLFSACLAKKIYESGEALLECLQNRIFFNKKRLKEKMLQLGFSCLPSHPCMPVLVIYGKRHNLYEEFRNKGIVADKMDYYRNILPFNDTFIRIRIPYDKNKVDIFLKIIEEMALY